MSTLPRLSVSLNFKVTQEIKIYVKMKRNINKMVTIFNMDIKMGKYGYMTCILLYLISKISLVDRYKGTL